MPRKTQSQTQVLVTGGAGFIGNNLVRMLLRRGYDVTVADNLEVGHLESLEGLPIQFVQADVRHATHMREVVAGHDAVVHLAAQTGVPGSVANPRLDCEVNILGTLNVLEACRATGVTRVVFASSNAPLGRQEPPASEDKAPLPISPYGASKLAGEAYCLAYHGSWGLETVVLRFGNVYGPFSGEKVSVIAKFFKDILGGNPIVVDGDGLQTRDFIYVEDLCHAVLCALESEVAGEVFQIASGVATSIAELVELIQGVADREVRVVHGEGRRGDIRRSYSGIEKAHSLLGWQPQTGHLEGLRATWTWFQERAQILSDTS
ncbi:MAG: NAD-dependent epimerase/dehydratase family protein [Chloroflexota bacterium]|nr:NAD-dependent epimerase/dehydratase family protein [Chloroflexota bacterium]